VADLLTKALAMGGTGLGLARQLLGAMSEKPDAVSGNGAAPAPTLLEKTPTPKPRHD